jgi:hypothetical protein
LGDLLDITIKKIKQEKELEKQRLKENLEAYKKIIDIRKNLLKSMKEEFDYQNKLAEKQNKVSNLQAEIAELSLDDSEEAIARRLAMEEELAEVQQEIAEDQFDRSIDLQTDALDAEYDAYEEMINGQIDAIDDYLDQPGQITADAIDLINGKSDAFYEDLMAWNQVYGDGLRSTIVSAWNDAYEELMKYKNALGEIDYQHASGIVEKAQIPKYHTGGVVGGSGEQLAKLMAGEVVLTPDQINKFMKITLPQLAQVTPLANGGVSFENFMPIQVSGNLDKSVIPDIEAIANKAMERINDVMRQRGYNRLSNQFSS